MSDLPSGFPDLLFPNGELRLDRKPLMQGLAFAFASGDGGELIESALERARVGESTFVPAGFARELFLGEVAKICFPLGGIEPRLQARMSYLERILSEPPKDPEVTAFRRAITDEIRSSPLVFEQAREALIRLEELRRALVASAGSTFAEQHENRLEILRALRRSVAALGAIDAKSGGLQRVKAAAEAWMGTAAFTRLSEFLDYEGGLAEVSVSLRLGTDGRVRGFAIERMREDPSRTFHQPWPKRLWDRIVMMLRGYRFAELEIVSRLLDELWDPISPWAPPLLQLGCDLQFYLGAVAFESVAKSRGLSLSLPTFFERQSSGGPGRALQGLFNPLLFTRKVPPKPVDFRAETAGAIVMLTGPNSGGKTRLLQAVAIAQLLGQSGTLVPAAAASLPFLDGLYVSLSNETEAAAPEGRLGTELMRIRTLFETLGPRELVVFDELCSGTNPTEAEAIIELVLTLFAEVECEALLTTHFLDFAERLERESSIARLEFMSAVLDADRRPLYSFERGIATSALASDTALRLGVTLEELTALVARQKRRADPGAALPAALREASLRDADRHERHLPSLGSPEIVDSGSARSED